MLRGESHRCHSPRPVAADSCASPGQGRRYRDAVPAAETTSTGSATPEPLPARSWLPQWVLLVLVWGNAFLLIKVGVEVLAPVQVAFARVALGAAFLLVLSLITRTRLPRSRGLWLDLAVVSVFMNVLPFTLFAFGETRISSVLAGIWNATTPLWTVLLGLAILPSEKVGAERWTGLAVGFTGVLVVLGVWNGLGGSGDWLGSLACIAATACYGVALPYTRRRIAARHESPMSVITGQLLVGSAILAVVTALTTRPPASLPWSVVWAMLALGVLCTGLAFLLNFRIVRHVGSLASASVTYATPIVSTVAGVVVLGESLTWYQPVGAVVILSGVALVQGFLTFPRRR